MGVATPIDDSELASILDIFEASIAKGYTLTQTYGHIARKLGRNSDVIAEKIRGLRSTTKLAEAKLRAASSTMVERVIGEADVDQLIGLLERPNIGVLAPTVKNQGAGGGFFLSVTADSCGAVKIGVATGSMDAAEGQPTGQRRLPEGQEELEDGAAFPSSSTMDEVVMITPTVELATPSLVPIGLQANERGIFAVPSPRPAVVQEAKSRLEALRMGKPVRKKQVRKNRPASDYRINLSYEHESFPHTMKGPPDGE